MTRTEPIEGNVTAVDGHPPFSVFHIIWLGSRRNRVSGFCLDGTGEPIPHLEPMRNRFKIPRPKPHLLRIASQNKSLRSYVSAIGKIRILATFKRLRKQSEQCCLLRACSIAFIHDFSAATLRSIVLWGKTRNQGPRMARADRLLLVSGQAVSLP
jgi:hypothetical protein